MWRFEGGPQSPGEIRALVLELLGPEGSTHFWQKYRENYVTREDITLLHRPASTPFEFLCITAFLRATNAEGFKLLEPVDPLVPCRRSICASLICHAAPGGPDGR